MKGSKRPTADEILKKYGKKIDSEVEKQGRKRKQNFSISYENFKDSMSRELTPYERWCHSFGNFLKVKLSDKDFKKINKEIEVAHLDVTPSQVLSLAFMSFMAVLAFGILFSVGVLLITDSLPLLFLFLVLVFSIFLFYYMSKATERLALKWRLKASSQMVPAILYVVIYMKHTSNLERAIAFAAEHLQDPLGQDFKKIFWDVEIGKYSTIKDSLDAYLEGWRDYSSEFIEAFHLIESSLYEPSEERRVSVLEKSLQVILDGVYDKMLKYTHEVKAPMTNIYMLGIVLPTLALAILPLASTMLQGAIKAYHVFVLFNLIVPFLVIYMTGKVLFSRPGGHGEATLLEQNPLYPVYKSKKPFIKSALMVFPLFLLGILPLIWMYTPLHEWLNLPLDPSWSSIGFDLLRGGMFGISNTGAGLVGPTGVLSLLLSLFVPISIALFFAIAYKEKTAQLVKTRDQYKGVEAEFTSSLFQMGNRMSDGMPAEIVFAKVLESSKGTSTEGFFRIVNENIQQMGMSLENALFNPRRGAVIFYPSQLIATSMEILVESVKKGLKVAAKSLMSISEYVKNIKKIDARLNDLLAEITSDMKSNMTFLAPLLSGVIVGLSGMISVILVALGNMLDSGADGAGGLTAGLGNFVNLFDPKLMMPTYWLQVAVGIYLIEIVFILTATLIVIKYGRDELQKTYETGINLKRAVGMYIIIALISILGLSLLGSIVLARLG